MRFAKGIDYVGHFFEGYCVGIYGACVTPVCGGNGCLVCDDYLLVGFDRDYVGCADGVRHGFCFVRRGHG